MKTSILPTLAATLALAGLGVAGPAKTLKGPTDPKKPSPSAYAAEVLKLGPVGYWRLGEPKGTTAFDSSGHKRNGIYLGNPAFHQLGALHNDPDRAVRLDGKSYVEIRNSAAFSLGPKGMTVEAWMRPDVLDFPGQHGKGDDPYVHWLGKGETNQFEWGFRFYSRNLPDGKRSSRPNRISAYIWNADGGEGAGAYFEEPLTAGKWIYVVAVYEPVTKPNAGVLIYRDGVLKKGPPSKGTLYNTYNIKPKRGTAPLRLGTRDLGSFLVGGLDEVAIYPRVLAPAEIEHHYVLGTKGALRPLDK
jgi:hypothetical protein